MDRFWFSITGFTTTTLVMICLVPLLLIFSIVCLTIVFCCVRNREDFLPAHTETSPSAFPSTTIFSLRNPFRRSRNQAFRSRCGNNSRFHIQRGPNTPTNGTSYQSKIPFHRGWNINLENQVSLWITREKSPVELEPNSWNKIVFIYYS